MRVRGVGDGREGVPNAARRWEDAGVGATRSLRMIPDLYGGLVLDRAARFTHGAGADVAHRIADLPRQVTRAFEDLEVFEVGLEKAILEMRIRRLGIGSDAVIEGSPPDLVYAGPDRGACEGAEWVRWQIGTHPMTRVHVVVVVLVQLDGEADLLEIAKALGLLGRLFGLGKDREKDRGQNGDNRDDDEEFDQSESVFRAGHVETRTYRTLERTTELGIRTNGGSAGFVGLAADVGWRLVFREGNERLVIVRSVDVEIRGREGNNLDLLATAD